MLQLGCGVHRPLFRHAGPSEEGARGRVLEGLLEYDGPGCYRAYCGPGSPHQSWSKRLFLVFLGNIDIPTRREPL